MILQFKGQQFHSLSARAWELRIDDEWNYKIFRGRRGWFIVIPGEPTERIYYQNRDEVMTVLLDMCHLLGMENAENRTVAPSSTTFDSIEDAIDDNDVVAIINALEQRDTDLRRWLDEQLGGDR